MLFNGNRIRRLFWVFLIVLSGGLIIFAALKTFEENLVFFYTPSQILNGEAPKNRPIRIGGMVEPNSVNRDEHSLGIVTIRFEVFLNILFLSFKIKQPQKEIEENHRKRKSKTNPNNGFMTHLISTRQSF